MSRRAHITLEAVSKINLNRSRRRKEADFSQYSRLSDSSPRRLRILKPLLAIISIVSFATCVLADSPDLQPEGVAEKLIVESIANRRLIDLATNSTAASNRIVRGAFIEWLLTKNLNNIHHGGLRLRNAIITNWLDLRNVEVPCEVQLECCHFKSGVNLAGAHFLHNLSFQGSRFDTNFEARGLKVDGSLILNTRTLSSGQLDLFGKPTTTPELANYLRMSNVYNLWPLLPSEFAFDKTRQIVHWEYSDHVTSPTNNFTATLRGEKFLFRQISGYRPQPGAPIRSSVEFDQFDGVITNYSESVFLDALRPLLTNSLDISSLSHNRAVKRLTTARWPLVQTRSESGAEVDSLPPTDGERVRPALHSAFDEGGGQGPYVIWYQGDGSFIICQETVFAGEIHLDGASIGANLEAWDAEFRKNATFNGVTIGGNVFLEQARFLGTVSFGYLRTAHDFSIASSFFGSGNIVNAFGLEIGGTLNFEWAHFGGSANFGGGHISKELRANYVRFPNSYHVANFRGLNVDGSVQLRGAEFAAPATFILAKINGNFEAQNSVFEDDRSFEDLQYVTQDSFTFNTDFGSMTVDGFAIFESACFARSVSFRNGAYGNLYFDGVQWPDATYMRDFYTNEPFSTNLLRLEGINFRTIRDITSGAFFHSRQQLKESQINLVNLLQNYTPYSFDIYAKLEAYFRGEGERSLANQVFISAKKREGAEAGPWGRFVNKFLRYTIMYGKWPGLAFGQSLVVVILLSVLCETRMLRKDTHTPPSFPLAFLYSLGNCLPLVDLKTADLLEFKPGKDRFRYLLAFTKILGYILVPLWAVAWAGLVK
jgi:hypothetical protein